LPVVDNLASEYGQRVAFVAPAWKGTLEDTAARAAELMPSGEILWGLDEEEEVFGAFGIPYQPATVLIDSEGRIVDSWAGARSEAEMRSALESLVASSS
jgi:hypothetical protein